jgi:NADH-quinone oxidoreductase subunit C
MADEQADAMAEEADPRPLSVRKATEAFGDAILSADVYAGEWTLVVAPDRLLDVLAFLKEDDALRYDHLSDLTAVDCLEMDDVRRAYGGARFLVVYQLYAHQLGHDAGSRRLRVKCPVREDDPVLPSVVHLWFAANWPEREVWDMFGIRFSGHPDLRRILMPDDSDAHPLRKDYPLRGQGEREHFDFQQRRPER